MRYPENLHPGGTIGFVAPSLGCATEPYKSAFQNAQKILTEIGYSLDLGPNCYAAEGIGISNSPKACAEELEIWYARPQNDVLISCGGGELMNETISAVDFTRIAQAKPKWYMGYSDNTNMVFLLTTLCDTAAVYGPCAGTFGMEPWHESVMDALQILTGERDTVCGYDLWEKERQKCEENPLLPYKVEEKRISFAYPNGRNMLTEGETLRMSGRLLGGCLDVLVNICGTRFDYVEEFVHKYREDGIVWFLEACDLNVFAIRRALWQLKEAGWFRNARGFLIGRPGTFGQEIFGLDQYQAVLGVLGDLGLPVIMDLDIGHLPPMMPLIVGSMADVRFCNNEIRIQMKKVL